MLRRLRKGSGRPALLAWAVFVLALGIASACSDGFAPRYVNPNDSTEDTTSKEQGFVLPAGGSEFFG